MMKNVSRESFPLSSGEQTFKDIAGDKNSSVGRDITKQKPSSQIESVAKQSRTMLMLIGIKIDAERCCVCVLVAILMKLVKGAAFVFLHKIIMMLTF